MISSAWPSPSAWSGQIDGIIERLINLFDKKANIPEIVIERAPRPLGAVHRTTD